MADFSNGRIRAVSLDGVTTTLAGTGVRSREDRPVATAAFERPTTGIAAAPDGSIYVVDDHSIRKISGGIVTTLAGRGEADVVDGPGNGARFSFPVGMAFTPSGMLIVCDLENNRLRRVDPKNGHVTTVEHPFPSTLKQETAKNEIITC